MYTVLVFPGGGPGARYLAGTWLAPGTSRQHRTFYDYELNFQAKAATLAPDAFRLGSNWRWIGGDPP
jgi:hypothetical protein